MKIFSPPDWLVAGGGGETVGGRVVASVVLLWANILIEMTWLTGLTVVSLLGISEVLIFLLTDGMAEEL